jgi:hypothetical protein
MTTVYSIDLNFSAPIFKLSSKVPFFCNRYNEYNSTTRSTVIGTAIFGISLINIILHTLLLSTIIFKWKSTFCHDFVYKLVINMNIMSILYSVVTVLVICPCILFGCLSYSDELLQFFTSSWRGMEYGVYFVVFFIALDRFFAFYFNGVGKYFRKVSSRVSNPLDCLVESSGGDNL